MIQQLLNPTSILTTPASLLQCGSSSGLLKCIPFLLQYVSIACEVLLQSASVTNALVDPMRDHQTHISDTIINCIISIAQFLNARNNLDISAANTTKQKQTKSDDSEQRSSTYNSHNVLYTGASYYFAEFLFDLCRVHPLNSLIHDFVSFSAGWHDLICCQRSDTGYGLRSLVPFFSVLLVQRSRFKLSMFPLLKLERRFFFSCYTD